MRKYISPLLILLLSYINLSAQYQKRDLIFVSDTTDMVSYNVVATLPFYMIRLSQIDSSSEEGIDKIYPNVTDSSCIIINDIKNRYPTFYHQKHPFSKVNRIVNKTQNNEQYEWVNNGLYFREDYYRSNGGLSIMYLNVTVENKLKFDSLLNNIRIKQKQ